MIVIHSSISKFPICIPVRRPAAEGSIVGATVGGVTGALVVVVGVIAIVCIISVLVVSSLDCSSLTIRQVIVTVVEKEGS